MARSLRILALGVFFATVGGAFPVLPGAAHAAELDRKGKSDAKEAMRFYKEGNYEDAAKLFVRLSIAYPDMLVFVRNLGACYYYMRRYEPALSNLRDYLHRKTDIDAADRAEVSGWIGEMERLRDQATAPTAAAAAPPATSAPTAAPAPVPVPAPVPAPAPTPSAVPVAPASAPAGSAGPSTGLAPAGPAAPAAETTYPSQAQYPQQPQYPGQYGAQAQPQPQYQQPAPYGAQPQYPPQGPYGAQPQYPPSNSYGPQPQYGQAPPPAYSQPGYPPPGGAPMGVAAQAAPVPPSSGSGRRVGAWVLGIAGVGALATGGVLTYLALDKFSKVESKYDPSLEKSGKSLAVGAGVCYAIGGVALVSGIILGVTGGSSGAVALAPAVGPGSAGATLSGSF
jgi:hypothetical protein